MSIAKDTLDQMRHLLRPIATRVANTIARAVVQLVDDEKMMQLMQVGVLADETVEGDEGAEHFQPYGFTSFPFADAEAVVVFPNGDRGHPLVIVAADRRHRPTGGDEGEVTVYNHTGAKVILLASGNIEIQPGTGGELLIRDSGGSVDRLVKKAEYDAHVHTSAAPSNPTSPPTVPAVGTQRVRAQ